MARKRDYKAEYARRKARDAEAGLTPRQTTRMRKEAREWSEKHSHVKSSKYKRTMKPSQLKDYLNAFVNQKGKPNKQIKRDIWQYLTDWEGETAPWKETWISPTAR